MNFEPLAEPKTLTAKHYYSGFSRAHDTYNALSAASDGKIYYILSSDNHEIGGQMFAYDPASDSIRLSVTLQKFVAKKI
jgi:hypothetical protein